MKACKRCGKSYRVGHVVFVSQGGGLVRAHVCGTCADKATPVLMAEAANVCACGEPATTCGKCLDKKVDAAARGSGLKKAVRAIRKIARAYETPPDVPGSPEYCSEMGRHDGLIQAADILEKGNWTL